MTFELVQSGVYLSIIKLPGAFADALEHKWLGIEPRVNAQDIQNDPRSWAVVPRPDNVSIADDK